MAVLTVDAISTDINPARLVFAATSDLTLSPAYGAEATPDANDNIHMVAPALAAGSWYGGVERGGKIVNTFGPVSVSGDSPKIIFGSCCDTGDNPAVFDIMEAEDADLLVNHGDKHYRDQTTNIIATYRSNLEEIFDSVRYANVVSKTPTLHLYDDHDVIGGNNAEGNTPGSETAAQVHRERFHYPGLHLAGATDGIFGHVDLGAHVRVLYLDQRRYGGDKSATDDISKSILGATQKTWLETIIPASAGKFLIVCSTRVFHATTQANADHWGGFTAERAWLCNLIKVSFTTDQCLFIMGDQHQMGIEAGTNFDYATDPGGHPMRGFMAAPFSQSDVNNGAATWTTPNVYNNGQFGIVQVTSTGASSVDVTLTGKNDVGGVVMTSTYSVSL